MMFVSGETGDAAPETTSMIECIVQDQVKEMVSWCRLAFVHCAGPLIVSVNSFSDARHWQLDVA